MTDDATLLKEFASQGSETAFAELVGRHVNLVHAAALRQVAGDPGRAQDVTQAVFCELARKAAALRAHPCLAGWLYSTARHIAARLQRADTRRAARETAALAMNETTSAPERESAWREIRPLLDEAMGELGERDREAVILRYFQDRPLSEVGAALRLSDNAARMRVERALERLRHLLSRKGVKSSAALLGAALAANAAGAAPAGLAASVLGPALAGAAAAGAAASTTLTLLHFMTAAHLKTTVATVALIGAAAGLVATHTSNKALRREVETLQAKALELEGAQAGVGRPALGEADSRELARLRGQVTELARLRGDVTLLKRQLADAQAAAATRIQSPRTPAEPPLTQEQRDELSKNLSMAKLSLTRVWGGALLGYAMKHGKMPQDIFEAQEHLPEIPAEVEFLIGLASPSDFEMMFRGSLADLKSPERTIILKEKEAFNHRADGRSSRTYLFADGHSEIYTPPNGDFETWEKARLFAPPGEGQ